MSSEPVLLSPSVGEKRSRSPPTDEKNDGAATKKVTSSTAAVLPSTAPTVLASLASPEAFEQLHVHDVYNVIAPHFSSTRYKPWPRVKAFVEKCVAAAATSQPAEGESEEKEQQLQSSGSSSSSATPYGVLLVDVGCGNGKNMCFHDLSACYGVGCDRSVELMRAAELGARRTRKVEVVEVRRVTKITAEDAQPQATSAATEAGTSGELTSLPADVAATAANEDTVKGGKKKKNPPQVHTKKQIKVSTEVAVPEALQRGLEHCGADAIATPYRSSIFDIVISIAVIHHFSTHERRLKAVHELLRLCLPRDGRVLIYVWAKEQAKDRGDGVDVFVPWALHQKFSERNPASATTDATQAGGKPDAGVLQRYYHLFVKGELEALCEAINDPTNDDLLGGSLHSQTPIRCKIQESFYDQENWCVVLSREQ